MSNATKAVNDLLHLFFPHICAGCGTDVVSLDHRLCLHCISELPITNFFEQSGNPVERKFYGRLDIDKAASAYFFTKDSIISSLIYELKYKGNKELGNYLGELLGHLLVKSHFNNIDVFVPLPLNAKRLRKRGYNQSTLLCEGIAKVYNRPILNNAVVRKVNTETQTHRGRITRWENMDGVFEVAEPHLLQDKHILLVDDVVTTGASLEACGTEILKVEGTTLSLATLAYTI